MASDHGYKRVVGVDKSMVSCDAALEYRDAIGYDYTVLNQMFGGFYGERGDFDIDELPIADVTLMSNFHYHVDLSSWLEYVDRLRAKSIYCLIVSTTNRGYRRWRVNANPNDLLNYFKDWEHVATIDNVITEGDPSPRPLFSMLFKSPLLKRIPTSEIIVKDKGGKGEDGIRMLAEQIVAGDSVPVVDTVLYKDWRQRKPRWSKKRLARFVIEKAELIKSLVEHGPREPLLVEKDTMRLCDGSHRLVILETLGYETVIVREV
jgi:hypothetical protein